MKKTLSALTAILIGSLSGPATAEEWLPTGPAFYTDALRTTLSEEFDVGQTVFGRINLEIASDFDAGDPPDPALIAPLTLSLDDVFDGSFDPLDPSDYSFTPGASTFLGPVATLDFTMTFSVADPFMTVFFSTTDASFVFGSDPTVFTSNPGQLAFAIGTVASSEGVPAPGALALLGLGLIGLGMRRRTV